MKIRLSVTWLKCLVLVTNTDFNSKIKEIKDKISDVSGLVANTAFNPKIRKTEDDIQNNGKYMTTQKFNKLTVHNFAAKLIQAKTY